MGTQILNSLDDISEYDLAYAEEDLLLQVTEQIAEYLSNNGLRQSDLAVALGVSDARVSQLMSGEANPTLKTVARVALALNCTISLEITEKSRMTDTAGVPASPRPHVPPSGGTSELAS